MGNLNKVLLIGRVGKDPEITYTNANLPICKFSLATTEYYKGKDGEKKEKPQWHRIVVFGKLAETAGKLTKGSQVYLEGSLSYGEYTNKENVKVQTTDIMVNSMQLLDARKDSEAAPEKKSPAANSSDFNKALAGASAPDDDDSLPF